jgi:peptidyl-prolyl cis-trans isomerase C
VRARWLVALLLAGSCGGGQPASAPQKVARVAPGEHWDGSLSPRPGADAVAVAEVNGDTIWDVDVARHAAARHLDARAALDELVELELLAQEAKRRGLADDPQVAEARKQARVRAFIASDFAAIFKSPADVPQADIDLAWSNPRIYLRYNHQLYHEVRFVRLDLRKESTPREVEDLRRKLEKIRAAVIAAHPDSKEAFGDAAEAAAHEQGVALKPQDHSATEGGTVKEFLDVAMALEKPGDISPVTRTPWGWDLLYLYNIIPAIRQNKEQATPDLRQRIFDESRSQGFLAWVDKLVQKVPVVRHDELLADDNSDGAAGQPGP